MYIYIFIFFLVFNVTLSFTFSEEIQEDFLEQIKAQYKIEKNGIYEPLTDTAGNSVLGRAIVSGRKANCLACHTAPIPEEKFHGNFGPDLSGIGSRRTKAEIRLQLVIPRYFNPDSIMPSYFRIKGLRRVDPVYKGKTILSAQDIEDVVSYLATLKDSKN
tara:strand:- start:486 stop:965 length:480 start_codon:yes stop_codon:yes gene_type:complete